MSRVTLIPITALLVVVAIEQPARSEDASLDDVLRAWRVRQDRFASLEIEWNETRTDVRGSLTVTRQLAHDSSEGPAEFPSQDTTYQIQHRVVATPSHSRVESRGQIWDFSSGMLVPRNIACVSDGREVRTLLSEIGGQFSQQGTIDSRPQQIYLNAFEYRPLLWSYWPLDRTRGGFDADKLLLTSERADLNGRDCILLKDTSRVAIPDELWLDPANEYQVVRAIVRTPDGGVHYQVDMEYDPAEAGLQLHSWTQQELLQDRVQVHSRSVVTSIVENADLVPGEFDVAFPAGAIVNDIRTGGNNFFVVNPGGGLEPVGSVPPMSLTGAKPGDPAWGPRSIVLIALNSALAVVLLVLFIRHRRKRQASS